MFKKSILFLFILTSAFAFPMRRYASGLFTRHAANIGSKALTITGHSIAWGLPLYAGYKGTKALLSEPLNYDLASKQTIEFCHEEIKKYDINPELLTITASKGFALTNWGGVLLHIPIEWEKVEFSDELRQFANKKLQKQNYSEQACKEIWELEDPTYSGIGYCLKKKKILRLHNEFLKKKIEQNTSFFSFLSGSKENINELKHGIIENKEKIEVIENYLDSFKGLIGHEMGHLKYKDVEIGVFKKLICAGLVEIARLGLKKIVPFRCNPLIKNLLQIPSGCARLTGTLYLNSRYNQHIELRADDFVRNDIDILQAMAHHFYQHDEDENEFFQTSLNEVNLKEKIKLIANHRVFRVHPYSSFRAKKFEKRIELLKREQVFAQKDVINDPDAKESEIQ